MLNRPGWPVSVPVPRGARRGRRLRRRYARPRRDPRVSSAAVVGRAEGSCAPTLPRQPDRRAPMAVRFEGYADLRRYLPVPEVLRQAISPCLHDSPFERRRPWSSRGTERRLSAPRRHPGDATMIRCGASPSAPRRSVPRLVFTVLAPVGTGPCTLRAAGPLGEEPRAATSPRGPSAGTPMPPRMARSGRGVGFASIAGPQRRPLAFFRRLVGSALHREAKKPALAVLRCAAGLTAAARSPSAP
ncbi:hypothetical protein QFZ27_001780 [Inquilinus ginsengisoli]